MRLPTATAPSFLHADMSLSPEADEPLPAAAAKVDAGHIQTAHDRSGSDMLAAHVTVSGWLTAGVPTICRLNSMPAVSRRRGGVRVGVAVDEGLRVGVRVAVDEGVRNAVGVTADVLVAESGGEMLGVSNAALVGCAVALCDASTAVGVAVCEDVSLVAGVGVLDLLTGAVAEGVPVTVVFCPEVPDELLGFVVAVAEDEPVAFWPAAPGVLLSVAETVLEAVAVAFRPETTGVLLGVTVADAATVAFWPEAVGILLLVAVGVLLGVPVAVTFTVPVVFCPEAPDELLAFGVVVGDTVAYCDRGVEDGDGVGDARTGDVTVKGADVAATAALPTRTTYV